MMMIWKSSEFVGCSGKAYKVEYDYVAEVLNESCY